MTVLAIRQRTATVSDEILIQTAAMDFLAVPCLLEKV
jgi:hypothetical protein